MELCEPCEITTLDSLPNRLYLCIRCGLDAVEEPPKIPVCLNKGGRKTDGQ